MSDAPQGLLGFSLSDLIPDFSHIIPGPVGEAIKNTVDKILDPNDDSIKMGDPQPAGQRPIPTTDPKELNAAVRAIDSAIGGIALVLKFGWLIPDQYEAILHSIAGALQTIRRWLV